MTRQELISKYSLHNYSIHNSTPEVTYKYIDKFNIIVSLEHYSQLYYFTFIDKNSKEINSIVYDDFSREEQFDMNYKKFLQEVV